MLLRLAIHYPAIGYRILNGKTPPLCVLIYLFIGIIISNQLDAVITTNLYKMFHRWVMLYLLSFMLKCMSCHVTSPSSLCDGWLRGWVSADQRPLSRAMHSRLAPDWSVHATMLSIQHDLGLPRFLVPSTGPVITLPSMLSCGNLMICPK